jgi:CelD/BcsL family acetyltransferase involved in cellulose biosynthesis
MTVEAERTTVQVNPVAPIRVKLSDRPGEAPAQWAELVRRGSNAFMDPAALRAAAEASGDRIVTLEAWAADRLVGFWALCLRRPLPFLGEQLEALPYEYAFLSTPVTDPRYTAEAMAAFVHAIAGEGQLPKTLWLKDFDRDSALLDALAALPQLQIRTQSRPVVSRHFGVKATGSTRKKLRQDWNRLCAAGETEIINVRNRDAALAGLEAFFALEAQSWKGEQGTALANREADARFARQMVGDMAANGDASVAQLLVDGKVIAAQVLLYGGTTAFTWKIAYDQEWSRYSPGTLLVDKLTETLLADEIESIDSCALDTGFMGRLWEGRKETVDLLVCARPQADFAFRIARAYHWAYQMLRQGRDQWRQRGAKPAKRS